MREFCHKSDCSGLIDFSGDPMDGDIGICETCGAEHEARVHIEVVLLHDAEEKRA